MTRAERGDEYRNRLPMGGPLAVKSVNRSEQAKLLALIWNTQVPLDQAVHGETGVPLSEQLALRDRHVAALHAAQTGGVSGREIRLVVETNSTRLHELRESAR